MRSRGLQDLYVGGWEMGVGYIARSKSAIFRRLCPPNRTSAVGPMPNCDAQDLNHFISYQLIPLFVS